MPKFVLRNGSLVDKDTGEPADTPPSAPVACPQVRGDIAAYRSPITGEVIDGRAARREDLKRHGCREVDPSEWHGGFRKERYHRKEWEIAKRRA